jgi:hypothetical protein
MRLFIGKRIGGFFVGASFRPQCSHCGKTQPFSWPGFLFGAALGAILLYGLLR